ncbi:hypothetical protein BJV78DRAFT_1380098 [Lactifluus subvellereus]|nr:hypothetical protein BJV78DRAFT_1380098 [Lactifluus subvellereus]
MMISQSFVLRRFVLLARWYNQMNLYQSAIHEDDNHAPSVSSTTATAATQVKSTSAHRPFTPEFVQAQLSLPADRSRARAQALYNERVRRRQLVLAEKSQGPRNSSPRQRRKQEETTKRRRVMMGRREAAEKGLWRLREEEARWDLFVPLHRLWLGYMSELLALNAPPLPLRESAEGEVGSRRATAAAMPQAAGMHAKLVKADFHGSIMIVRRNRNAALVGASGIVVQETENTFKVVMRKNRLKVLPKRGSVFTFVVLLYSAEPSAVLVTRSSNNDVRHAEMVLDGPHIEFELYGNQFCFRGADRAGRKFKYTETIALWAI